MSRMNEPIAIIGLGCCFPGGSNTAEEFWRFLCQGGNGITEIPPERWNADAYYHPDYNVTGKIGVKWGGFVKDIDRFDAPFFNISPREALRLDPQQRILLETSCKALEDAGQDVNALSGRDVGVFVGISSHDYGDIEMGSTEHVNISGHTITGGAASIASNRISYVFNFKGPSYSIDTACSSSLVAVHNACRSLWNGECSLALSGGVNALIKPEITMSFSQGGFLSPTGTCKAFDAKADGYIRSEGAGMLVLKPLSKARKDKDRIYAVIIGSAINHDGQTDGISMPSMEAQMTVLKKAYQDAGIFPGQVQYVEAHGTGTAIGDPTEATSLGKVVGSMKENNEKLFIGSVKSNIGHLEPASGAAGLIKLVLSMKNRKIPPNIHFKHPNPKIDFDKYNLRVPTKVTDWPAEDGNMYAGINSFGFGGANAHIVLKGYHDKAENRPEPCDRLELFVLSAKTPDALKAYAQKYVDFLSRSSADETPLLHDVCFTASTRRTHHDVRLSVVVRTKEQLIEQLKAFLENETRPGMISGRTVFALDERPKLCFVCSGQGPQWWAMGRQLIEKVPIFRDVIERCDEELKNFTDWSLMEELTRDEEHSRIGETRIVQPALFAFHIGLAKVWESVGIKPDAVVGHSIGEVAAAHLAGVLSFEEAVKVIYHRSNVQHTASGKGKMLAVGLSVEQAAEKMIGRQDRISIAAINGPTLVTLSGDTDVLEEIARSLDKEDVFHRFLTVDVPFHSHYMAPLKDELLEALKNLCVRDPELPLYSTVTGKLVEAIRYDANYWCRNIRETVQFTDAISAVITDGYTAFVELSPHPVLSRYISDLLSNADSKGVVVGSIRRKEDDMLNLLANLGALHSSGYPVSLKTLYEKADGTFIDLPLYPFQKERYWLETKESFRARMGTRIHPHIRSHTSLARSSHDHVWNIVLDSRFTPYISDHRVQGPIIFPGAGSCELALACGIDAFGDGFCFVEDMHFKKAVFLPDEGEPPQIQFNLSSDHGSFGIFSRQDESENWTRHIHGKLKHLEESFELPKVSMEYAIKRCTEAVDMETIYEDLYSSGLMLGPAFKGITECRRYSGNGEYAGEVFGQINAPEEIRHDLDQYNIHPAILDACFQVLFGSAPVKEGEKLGVYIPVHIERLRFYCSPTARVFCYGRLKHFSPTYIVGELRIYDDQGRLCLDIDGFRCRYIEGTRGERKTAIDTCIYEYRWNLSERPSQIRVRSPKDYLPSPSSLSGFARDVIREVRERPERKVYDRDFEPKLNTLTVAYIVNALKSLGAAANLEPGCLFTTREMMDSLGIAGGYIPKLFSRCLEIVSEYGILEKTGSDTWKVTKALDSIDVSGSHRDCEKGEKYGFFQYELKMLERCGPYLSDIFTGKTDPVELLFPDQEWETTVGYYRESYSFKKYNDIIRSMIQNMLKGFPEDQTLRIVEVGAGTGGVTAAILPVLPSDRTTYTFTDISPLFMSKAEQGFGEKYPFVEYRSMDITGDIEAQGFIPHSYDMVVASDVVHATPNVKETLKNIQKLLAPNGVFVMLEVTQCPWATDLVFGLTQGWWMFSDHDLRPSHPTMAIKQWETTFEDTGFTDVLALTDATSPDVSAQTVFLARNRDFKIEHEPAVLQDSMLGSGNWLIFSDRKGVGESIGKALGSLGETCFVVNASDSYSEQNGSLRMDPGSQKDMDRLFEKIKATGQKIKGIVHLWNIDLPPADKTTVASLEESVTIGCTSILNMFRTLFADGDNDSPRFWIVTCGAANIGNCRELSIAQAPVWGLGRTIMHEYQQVETILIDISSNVTKDDVSSVLEEILMDTHAEEVAIRGKSRYLNRFVRTSPEEEESRAMKTVSTGESSFRLDTRGHGILENLHFRETLRKDPRKGEVEIKVSAVGLNFKDVMLSTGLLHEDAPKGGYTGRDLGMECSGIVTSVGEDIKTIKPGDEVIAIAPIAFASFAVTRSEFVALKPQGLSFNEAATIPMACITASYCLNHIARIERGERVLIHSASGGVGLAAVRLALAAGAEVFATAGSHEKREFLKKLGIRHVMDSRSLDFAEEILKITDGEGVDIVLNSLAGSAAYKGMSILRRYGRFVEIGKTDIYEDNKLNLRPFWNNISYFAVDIDKLLAERPMLCGRIIREFMTTFNGAPPFPRPYKVFPASQVVDAFKFMASAKHIGKVVISMNQENLRISPFRDIRAAIREHGTYVITGGFSGLGLAVSRWLADNGAGTLVVISRSGARTDEAKKFMKKMHREWVNVVEVKANAADDAAMKKVFERIRKELPPVRGIINSAMVLDDAILPDMTHERFMNAIRPKVMGAWNLHRNTLDQPIDFFVNFSSISGQYGNPAQSNYAAANTFLDMFSHYRQANGLPGTTVSWGVISDVGFVARNEKVSQMLQNQGWRSFTPQEAINALAKMILQGQAHRTVADVDWQALTKYYPKDKTSHRFGHLMTEGYGAQKKEGRSLRAIVLSADPDHRLPLLQQEVLGSIARILGAAAEKLDPDTPVSYLGLDSLMANQLRGWIQVNVDVDFSLMKIMRGPSIRELTKQIFDEMDAAGKSSGKAGQRQETRTETDRWIVRKRSNSSAKIRLFCFPYMGGGASSFYSWSDALPDDIEVCAVQLPGREERIGEKPIDSLEDLLKYFADASEPLLDRPIAFYGHSIGASIAFEVARYLQNKKNIIPMYFFASGWPAPHVKSPFEILRHIEESEIRHVSNRAKIRDHLRTLEIAEEVLSNERLMKEIMPSVIADILIGKRYRYIENGGVLKCPIAVFTGEEDTVFPPEQIKTWSEHTDSFFNFYTLPGGHLFIRDSKDELLKIISARLSEVMSK